MDWCRLYNSIIDDPKIMALPPPLRWYYVALLSLASRGIVRGVLPDCRDIAFYLRVKPSLASQIVERLISAGLIDGHITSELRIHGWNKRQYSSDNSTPRVKRFRKRRRNVSETPPDTDTDTEREREILSPPDETFQSSMKIAILQTCEKRWGESNGAIRDFLQEFDPSWVKFACDETFQRFGSEFKPSYIRTILHGIERKGGLPKNKMAGPGPIAMPARTPEQYAAERAEAKRLTELARAEGRIP